MIFPLYSNTTDHRLRHGRAIKERGTSATPFIQ